MNNMKTAFAFLGGLAAGAAIALLLAPEKGEVTRRKIKNLVENELENALNTVESGVKATRKRVTRDINHGIDALDEGIHTASDAASRTLKKAKIK